MGFFVSRMVDDDLIILMLFSRTWLKMICDGEGNME